MTVLDAEFFHAVSVARASQAYHNRHTVRHQGPARILKQCATVEEARRHVFDYDHAKVERHGNATRIMEDMPAYHPSAEDVLAWHAAQRATT